MTELRLPVPEGVEVIDVGLFGAQGLSCSYLIDAAQPALIETGPATVFDTLRAELTARDVEPAHVVLSHIHLDHAGGAGDVASAFPDATVVVSDRGAHHLVDPGRLNASSRRVYGDLMDTVYGDCTPIAGDRIRAVDQRDTIDLGGGRSLEIFYTPGHAKHHIGVYEPHAGALFVGDSVGIKLPGMTAIRPATPPPDFDYVLAQRSLELYTSLAPSVVYLAHYGAADPPLQALAEGKERLQRWMEAAEAAYSDNPDLEHVAETLGRRFAGEEIEPGLDDPVARERLELLSGQRSNAMGLIRYLKLRAEGRVAS